MASFSTYHTTINYTGGSWLGLARYYLERQSVRTTTFIQYDLAQGSAALTTAHGVTFHADSTGILLDVNFGNDTSDPHTFSGGGNTNVSSGYVATGDSISLYNTNGGLDATFTVPDFGYSAALWTVTTTSTPATGTQTHSYVQDSLRNITCTKTAKYTHKWEFEHAHVSSGNWHASMGKYAVCYTCKHWPASTPGTSTDIVQQCFDQADGTYDIEIVSNTTFPNSQIKTGDLSTLHADIDMQISDGAGGFTTITAGDVIATFTYEATNVVFTIGSGYVGDTVSIVATDTNQFPDYDNTISFSYALDNPPQGHQGSSGQLTASIFNSTGPHKLESGNFWTLSGTLVVGDDGSASNTNLPGTLHCYRKTPIPQQLQIHVFAQPFIENPVGQNPNNRRRAHSFW